MDSNRWQDIERLFHAAMDRAPGERARLLDRDCAGDRGLRAEVESLLAAHEQAGSSFIESCPFEAWPQPGRDMRLPAISGRRIGRYTVCGVLGRGGSGIVYEARQDEPARVVALKVMRTLPDLDDFTPRMLRREAQALARLDHPGIATIYEAGRDDGLCFFAMERVEGLPLTAFAAERGLALGERLALFQRVCDAVHYAHQRGVIHRDLKPSNILVTPAGQPKVLDFGLARITAADSELTQLTEPGAFQGTLAYASPEQTCGGEVDTRSDVYSLGVVLFELLSGNRPYEVGGVPLPEAARIIGRQAPRPLRALAKDLRGDVETIVQKALAKEPDQRYSSAAALSEDIGRLLSGQAILAHPPSTAYLLRKLVSRHKAVSIAVIALVGILGAVAAAMTVLYEQSQANLTAARTAGAAAGAAELRARDEAERANASAAEARRQAHMSDRVRDFMTDVFADLGPRNTADQALSVSKALATVRLRLKNDLKSEPHVKGALLYQLALVYSSWGHMSEALQMYEEALKLQKEHLPPGHADTLKTLTALGSTLFNLNRSADGEPYVDEALSVLAAQGEPDPYMLGHALLSKGRILRGRRLYDEALTYFERAVPPLRSASGDESIDVIYADHCIGNVLRERGDLAEAQVILEDVVRRVARISAPDSTDVSEPMRDLGACLRARGCLQESEDVLRDAWGRMRRYLGPESPRAHGVLRQLAATLAEAGKFEEATAVIGETIAAHETPPVTLRLMLANVLMMAGAFDPAEAILRECVDVPVGDGVTARDVRKAREALDLCLARQAPGGL
jgi:tetratricopeptide (TPR) repeat protein/predicted Ser/Thr protein kinase